jgi:hypothetical protein
MMEALVRTTLARHREDPPPGLSCLVPIHHQMDQDFCGAISSDLKKYSTAWESRRATPDLWKQLPAETGIYMFVFVSPLSLLTTAEHYSPSWVLYVGRAGSATSQRTIKDRYKGEYCKYVGADPEILWADKGSSSRDERLAKYLAIYPLSFWYTTIAEREKIPHIEDCLIKLLCPIINGRQLPRLRPQPPQAAFRRIS